MEKSAATRAYGAALAGGGFDFQKFVRQPQTVVRVLSGVFALVVFACITTEGYVNPFYSSQAKCIFHQTDSACQYAVSIGVIAFLACLAFLVLDVYLSFMSSARDRKYVVMLDLGFSGVWTFLWFVCFCVLATLWGRTRDLDGIPQDAANATVAFSFFSIATWGILTYFALGRYRHGVTDVTVPTYVEAPEDHPPYPPTYTPTSYNPTTYTPTTYTVYPANTPDVHQPDVHTDAGYLPPAY
ncbi:synaptogyrin-2b [Thalassophryne amazonica]|uniref:synaptogyrin-2b n=1 Tax=Thalassophryne amazonica TaxID=390379 RepID=UPI001470EDE8|nr:synaptogyrin-2b [Thalassophryne amazonica]